MKNKIIISMGVFIVIGTFVAYFLVNNAKKEELSKSLTQNQIFERKQDCSKLRVEIEKNLREYYPIRNLSLEEIFYSPLVNSCLYVEHEISYNDGKAWGESYRLMDALTMTIIDPSGIGSFYPSRSNPDYELLREVGGGYEKRKLDFQKMVEEYKK